LHSRSPTNQLGFTWYICGYDIVPFHNWCPLLPTNGTHLRGHHLKIEWEKWRNGESEHNRLKPEQVTLKKRISTYHDLDVYRMAMDGAMEIFEITKMFPKEEKYSLTDQIRRSSRSVCANICESWRKRRYKLSFVSKLSDAETEAAETQVWLEFALRCKYIDKVTFQKLNRHYDQIIGKLVRMIDNPTPWLIAEIGVREKRRRSKQ